MKWLAALVLVAPLGACEKPSDPYPISPGGGGGSTGIDELPDGAIDDSDASLMIAGRVCVLSATPHALAGCDATGADGITVTLGDEMTTTGDDGAFMIMRPSNTAGLSWRVSAVGFKTSVIKFGTSTTLPSIDELTYAEMLGALQATVTAGQGALMTRVTRLGAAVPQATVSAAQQDSLTYYDGPSELEWQTLQTGSFGVAWIPSLPAGSAQLTVTSDETPTVITGHQVVADAITFVLAEIP
jgi:hypothetical protein